jgi:hypothetical protein
LQQLILESSLSAFPVTGRPSEKILQNPVRCSTFPAYKAIEAQTRRPIVRSFTVGFGRTEKHFPTRSKMMKLRGLVLGLCLSGLILAAVQNMALGFDGFSRGFSSPFSSSYSSGGYSFSTGSYKYWSNPSSSGYSMTFPDGSKIWGSTYGTGWSYHTPSGTMWGSSYNNGTQLWGWSFRW